MIETYLSVLRRRWPFVALATLVLAQLAWFGLTSSSGVYRSTAVVQVLDASVVEGVLGTSRSYQDPERLLASEMEVLGSRVVADATAEALRSQDVPFDTDDVRASIAFAPRGLSNFIEVVGSDADPGRAQALTTSFVDAYQQYKLGLQRDELERLDAELRDRLETTEDELLELDAAGVDDTGAAARQRAAVLGRYESLSRLIEDIRLRLSVDTSGVEVLTAASEPVQEQGVLPPVPAAVVALLAGFALACGLAVALDLLRDPVRTREEAQRVLPGVGTLGTLPQPSRGAWATALADPRSAVMRAARSLRKGWLEPAAGEPRQVVVTATPGDEGVREYVASVLASSAARSLSQEVLLVSEEPHPSVVPDAGAGDEAVPTSIPGVWWRLPQHDDGDEPAQEPDELGTASFRLVVQVADDAGAAGLLSGSASPPPLVLVVATLGSTPGRRLRRHVQDLEQEGAPAYGLVLVDEGRRRGRGRRGGRRDREVRPPATAPESAEGRAVTSRHVETVVRRSSTGPHDRSALLPRPT